MDNLDAEELLHIAGQAIDEGEHDRALTSLKALLELTPEDPHALYLLGAVHAEIGMYDRAIKEIGDALARDPEMLYPRFQLGLMLVMQERMEEGLEVWQPLQDLAEGDPLRLFEQGLRHYMNDEHQACIDCIEAGLSANLDIDALNSFMGNVLEDASQALLSAANLEPQAETGAPVASGSRLLSAYRSEVDAEDRADS